MCRCNLLDHCCEEYEQCVSCCQDPQYAPADLGSIYRAPDRSAPGPLWQLRLRRADAHRLHVCA